MILRESHKDLLQEIVGLGIGRAAALLNSMLSSHIELSVPDIGICAETQILVEISKRNFADISLVQMGFTGQFRGSTLLIIPAQGASALVASLMDDVSVAENEMDELRASTLTELGNVIINSVMGSISNILHTSLDYSVPTYQEGDATTLIHTSQEDPRYRGILVTTTFRAQRKQVEGDILFLFEIEMFDSLLDALDSSLEEVGWIHP